MSIPILEVQDLSYCYGTHMVFEHVHCILHPGDMLLIKGASGSGKSTLLSLISSCRPLQKGFVKIKGQEIELLSLEKKASLRSRCVGLIHQTPHMIPHLTVEENLSLPLWIQKKSPAYVKKIVTYWLERFNMHTHGSFFPEVLSGGEQQRLSCARACILSPDLIIADEPTNHLDHELRQDIWKLLHEQTQRGSAVIVVSHDSSIPDLNQKIVILHKMGLKN